MFPGFPARLRPDVTLHSLTRLADPGAALGVWLRGCHRPAAIRCRGPGGARHLLAADDLGYLLHRCSAVAVREGERVRSVPAAVLVGWRVLEIVLAAPCLPLPDQLHALFPAARVGPGTLTLPLGPGTAEEVLAACAATRLPVAASRIGYRVTKR